MSSQFRFVGLELFGAQHLNFINRQSIFDQKTTFFSIVVSTNDEVVFIQSGLESINENLLKNVEFLKDNLI